MLSRRKFLLSSFGLALFPTETVPAYARKRAAKVPGFYSLARQEWPPAILPDYVQFIDGGLSLFTDEYGRLAIVDLKRQSSAKVIGELNTVGKKVIDFCPSGNRAFAVTQQDSSSGDSQYCLTSVNLTPFSEPSVRSQFVLDLFTEPRQVVAGPDLLCVGGLGSNGENLISIFRPVRSSEPTFISSMTVDLPIVRMGLLDKYLIVLSSGRSKSEVYCINVLYPSSPQLRKTLSMVGDFRALAFGRNSVLVAGKSNGVHEARSISLEPTPHLVHTVPLGNVTAIYDAAGQMDDFLVLADRGQQRLVLPITPDKTLDLTVGDPIVLPPIKDLHENSRIAVRDRMANVAYGSTGVDVLNWDKSGWKHQFTYSIPRMPASGLAISGDWVVIAGADLSLYSIAQPSRPVLLQKAEPESAIKCVQCAGSYLLCLGKDFLQLRKMEKLQDVIASVKVSASDLVYDPKQQKAYALSRQDQKSILVPIKVFANNLTLEKPIPMPSGCRELAISDGRLLVAGLNDLYLYDLGASTNLLATKRFDNQAIRDICLTDQYAIVASVDHDSRGSLLAFTHNTGSLVPYGGLPLPQDAAALAVSGSKVVVVGRSPEGKDMASVIDLHGSSGLSVTGSLPVIQAASSVVLGEHLAIIAGRGLEIMNVG